MRGEVERRRNGAAEQPEEEREVGKESKANMGRVGDFAFKAFTAGLGVATLYLTVTFSVNVYRGLAWHRAQAKMEKEKPEE